MLKSKLFLTAMQVLTVGILLWAIAAMIKPDIFVPVFAQNEAPEIAAQQSFAGLSPEYATVNSFPFENRAVITVYAPGYDSRNRCRTDHWLAGQMILSKPFEVKNIEVVQQPGTPGGTTVKGGEGAIELPFSPLWKVVSNYPLTLGQMKQIIPPPYGFIKSGWAEKEPYAPVATITFQNCLADPPQEIPTR